MPWAHRFLWVFKKLKKWPVAQSETGKPFRFDDKALNDSTNLMDMWVLAYTQSLVRFTHAEMKGLFGLCF
jgi:hypothetical protein